MKRPRHFRAGLLVFAVLAALMLAGAAGGAAPAAKGPSANRSLENPFDAPLLAVRPRVFIRKDNFDGLTVARLREAVGRPEFAGIRQKWRAKPLGRAIEWMIDGRKEDLDAAVAGLKKMDAAGGTWSDRGLELVQLAALFDWLCDELDEPTRQAAVARLEKAADAAAAHVQGGQAPFFYSRTPGALAGLAVSGIALKGVSDKADGYLALFRDAGVKDYFKAYEWLDGAATGATYTTFYTYVDLPSICAAWWSATGRNPADWIRAAQGDWLDGIVRFYLWYMRPGFAFTDANDQSRGVWDTHDQFCQGLDIALYVTGNGCGRAWSQRWRARFGSALYHPEYGHNYLFRAAAPPPRPLTDLPLAQLFGRESCGYGFFRSAWPADGQPDTATHVFFRCGDPVDVHGGVSAGEFQVFRYAPLAARSGRYSSYDSPPDQYHRNCISTNVVLFLDPADPKDRGDQNTRRGLKSDHRTWADWLAIRERSGLDVARITDWQAADGEARCRADLTRTNPDTKCNGWVREFVWLARKHLVVLDVVETARPEVRRLWQLHSPTAPQIGDHLITIANKPPDRKWADEGLRPKNEEARLFCRTLLPKDYAVVLHSGGKAEAFAAGGQSRGGVEGNPYHLQYGSHVIQVDPGGGGPFPSGGAPTRREGPPAGRGGPGRTVFLHVLTAVDAAETTPPKAACRLVGAGRLEVTVDSARTVLAVPEWFKE